MNPDLITFTRRSDSPGPRADRLDPARWVRIRRGAFYPADDWARLDADDRHRLLVLATALIRRDPVPPLSHVSAARWWGLPVVGPSENLVHVRVPPESRPARSTFRPHWSAESPATVELRGMQVTDAVTTVVDIARTRPVQQSLATADAALRGGLVQRAQLEAAAEAIPAGHRGRSAARIVARLADARAESALESMSRGVMFVHRLAPPVLQVELRDERGVFGRGDFGWRGVVGECDGALKYGADVNGGDPSGVVYREKLREDRIRRFARVARWGWREAMREIPMVQLLREQGVPVVSADAWLSS